MSSSNGLYFISYLMAMSGADLGYPVAYHSRIDGAVLSTENLP